MIDCDFWHQEEFEDVIARGILACFESRRLKIKGPDPRDYLTDCDLRRVRNFGLYVPSKSRVVWEPDAGEGFDRKVDRLPVRFSMLLPERYEDRPGFYSGYCSINSIELLGRFPSGVCRSGAGDAFVLRSLFPSEKQEGVCGEKRYFSVDRKGVVHIAERVYQVFGTGFGSPMRTVRSSTYEPERARETLTIAPILLQYASDERHCWRIEAVERESRVRLGCGPEEVKSLLYARESPLTASGRKRPILHLVSSHRRRLREGIEIEIDQFLRGSREVLMDGTMFRVHAPQDISANQ